MAKRKGRAARKQQRKRVQRAQERGLPPAREMEKPARTRKVKGDTVAAAVASEREGRTRVERKSPESVAAPGLPVFAKVLIGAAVALVLVYALSHLRKNDSPASESGAASAPEANADSDGVPATASAESGSELEGPVEPVEQDVSDAPLEHAESPSPGLDDEESGQEPTLAPTSRPTTKPPPSSAPAPEPTRKKPTATPVSPAPSAPVVNDAPVEPAPPTETARPPSVAESPVGESEPAPTSAAESEGSDSSGE